MPGASAESIAATAAAAAAAWDRPVEVVEDLSFSTRATVLRIIADGATAVAKRHVEGVARGTELQALRLLPPGTRPELLAANDEIIVMSDLGDGPSLADLLLGDDASAAEEALLSWARTLGGIAAATAGDAPSAEVSIPSPTLEGLEEFCAGVDRAFPDRAWREIEVAREVLGTESRHHAFVPSDACPDNTRVTVEAVLLFDFEFSGWMHAAVPAAYSVVPFCSCWCLARMPEGLTGRMYTALCEAFPQAASDAFRQSVARAGVLQVLELLPLFGRWLDHDDNPLPVGLAPSTNQQRTIQRLDWISEQHAAMPATARFADELAHAYRQRHPSPELPLYPAFRSTERALRSRS